MDRIYLSFRRPYNTAIAGRIYDRLAITFGSGAIVRSDVASETTQGGNKALREAVRQCSVMVAVMGQGWGDPQDSRGTTLLQSGDDTVRIEIEEAIQHNLRILPVLVDGYPMPVRGQLPGSISNLTDKNALELDSGRRFDDDIRRIATALSTWVSTNRDITSPAALAQSLLVPSVDARPPRTGDVRRVETGYLSLLILEALALATGLTVFTGVYMQSVLPGCVIGAASCVLLIILLALPEWRLITSLLCAAGWGVGGYLAGESINPRLRTVHPDSPLPTVLPYLSAVCVFLLVGAINYSLYRRSFVWRHIVVNKPAGKEDKTTDRSSTN